MSDTGAKRLYLVTVKVPKNPDHNPRAKRTGVCPANSATCTDVTGEHHTVLIWSEHDVAVVERYCRRVMGHVTRVEETYGFQIQPTEEDMR